MTETTATLRDGTEGTRITLECDHTFRAAMDTAEDILSERADLISIEGVDSGTLTGTPTADFRIAAVMDTADLGRIDRAEMRRIADSGPKGYGDYDHTGISGDGDEEKDAYILRILNQRGT